MTDALSAKAAELFLQAIAALAEHGIPIAMDANDATIAFRDADLSTLNDAFYEAINRQARHLAKQAKINHDVRTKLEALFAAPGFHHVQRNYQFEARREPMRERRRMLMFAQAGSFNVEQTLAEIARVERTLRELDPDDVLALVHALEMSGEENRFSADALDVAFMGSENIIDALATSGCIREESTYAPISEPSTWRHTRLGKLVCKIMVGYANAHRRAEPER